MTAYVYGRVSTDEQAMSGRRPGSTVHIGVTEATRQGLDHQVIVDDGVTGTAPPDSPPALGPLPQSLANPVTSGGAPFHQRRSITLPECASSAMPIRA